MVVHFIEQVQTIMHVQQIKWTESNSIAKNNYTWLCTKKTPLLWITVSEEYLMRQSLNKVSYDQQTQVIKQLIRWLDENPYVHPSEIPKMCLKLLNQEVTLNAINEVNMSRMNSFRRSMRRLSLMASNKIGPLILPASQTTQRRSVTFKDEPIIYKISNR